MCPDYYCTGVLSTYLLDSTQTLFFNQTTDQIKVGYNYGVRFNHSDIIINNWCYVGQLFASIFQKECI